MTECSTPASSPNVSAIFAALSAIVSVEISAHGHGLGEAATVALPQPGPDDGLTALAENLPDLDDRREHRRIAVGAEHVQKFRIVGDERVTVHPDDFPQTRDEKTNRRRDGP